MVRLSFPRPTQTPTMKHAEKRANLIYAVLTVPPDVRQIIGKLRFVQSTQTGDKAEAALRVALLVTRWQAEIAKARGTLPSPAASFWDNLRKDHAKARADGDAGAQFAVEALIWDDLADPKRRAHGRTVEESSALWHHATGLSTPLAPLVTAWKASLSLKPKTMDQRHRDVTRMTDHFASLEALQPQRVKAWTDSLIDGGATAATMARMGEGCRSFWTYLQQSGTVAMLDPDPFIGPFKLAGKRAKRTNTGRTGTSYTPQQLADLYAAAFDKKDQPLADLIALGAYTGGRIEELCELTKETSKDGIFHGGIKTDAGLRDTPIHPAIVPLVARLVSASSDGYLIPSSADNKYGTRSDPLSKRFGHLKKAQGFDSKHVFHTSRNTLITLMQQAGVASETISDIVGHETGNFSLDKYSSGSSIKQKLEAISKVAYPAPLNCPA